MSLQRWHMRVGVQCDRRMMLDDPNRYLTEIAAVLSFADQSHFSRTFTQINGITPREWARRRSLELLPPLDFTHERPDESYSGCVLLTALTTSLQQLFRSRYTQGFFALVALKKPITHVSE